MAIGDVTWAQYQAFFGLACTRLESGDYLGARRAALQAKAVALGLGSDVSANGTSVRLLVDQAGKLIEEITTYAIEAYKLSGPRIIKTGLKNEGRNWNNDGGVLHD